MPDGKVSIEITADASGVKRGASQAEQALSGIERQASSGLGFGLMAGAGQAAFNLILKSAGLAVDAMKAVVSVGSQFESQMSRVEAISGASASDMAMLEAKAREMGATTAFSAKEAGAAMEYMAMAGWKAGDMVSGIGGIMNLAAASGEDLASVSDIVTDALTAFGMEAKDSGRFADVLAAASSNANTNVSMMGDTFKYVAPAAGALGYTVEDMAVAIGLMANNGIKGSQAGTALRSTLSRMAKPTKETREAMEKLGISLTDEQGTMLSFKEVMLNMRSGFSSLSESEKSAAAAMLGGQEAMSGLLAIANASEEDFQKLTDAIDGSAGAAERMADTAMDNLDGSMREFGSAASELGLTLFDAIKGPLTGLVDFGTGVINSITGFLKTEQSDLAGFLDITRSHADEAAKAIQASYDAIDAGEAEVGKLSAYEKVLLQVADAGKANEFQTYMIEKAMSELGDTMPEIAAAWDAETKTLRLNRDEIEKNFETRKRMARMDAVVEAQVQAQRALGEAELSRAMAEDAIWTAVGKANEEYKRQRDEMAKLGDESAKRADEVYQSQVIGTEDLEAAVSKLSNDVSGLVGQDLKNDLLAAYDAYESAGAQCDEYAAQVEHLDRMEASLADTSKEAAGDLEKVADATQKGADAAAAQEAAAAQLEAAERRMSKAYTDARDTVTGAFEDIKKGVENALALNPFEAWADSSQNGVEKMITALTAQKESIKEFGKNIQTIQKTLLDAGEDTGAVDAFVGWLSELGPAGATAVSQMSENAELLRQAMHEYVGAVDAKDAISSMLAGAHTALLAGLGELGSSVADWENLSDIVREKITASGLDGALTDAFLGVVEEAKAVGVAIPAGLAESIMTSEEPEAAIQQAMTDLENAMLGHSEALLQIASDAGLEVPAKIKAGLEAGGAEAKEALDQLIALFSGSDILQKAETAGSETGKKTAGASAKGAKGEAGQMTEAADANVNAYKAEVDARRVDVETAARGLAQAGATAAESMTGLWANAGNMAAAGFAGGIRNGGSLAISAATAVAAQAIEAAQKRLDERSPSRVFKRIGAYMSEGWAIGITSAGGMVTDATRLLAETSVAQAGGAAARIATAFSKARRTIDAGIKKGDFTETLGAATKTAAAGVEAAVSGAEGALKTAAARYFTALSDANAKKTESLQKQQKALSERITLTKDTGARAALEAQKKTLDAQIDALRTRGQKISKMQGEFSSSLLSSYSKALEGQADKITERLNATLEKAAKAAQDKMDDLKSKQASMKAGLLDIGTVWDGDTIGKGMLLSVKRQIADIRDYEKMLKQLEGRGISKTLLSEIEGMEAESAAGYMAALLGLSDKDLKQYDKLFRQRAKEATRVSKEHYAEEVEAVKTGYTDAVEKAFSDAQKSIAGMGEKAMAGFLKGMKATDYSREIRKIAKAIVSSMADELEIHSPSRKAEKLAAFFGQGWDAGIRSATDDAERAMEQYAAAALAAFAGTFPDMKAAAFARPDGLLRMSAPAFAAASPELATVPAGSSGGGETRVTLITTLDGREIARGTAVYTEAELARRQAIQARREGLL